MKHQISEDLHQFFKEFQHWIDAGLPEDDIFCTEFPICYTLECWADWKYLKGEEGIVVELKNLFDSEGLGIIYPFGGFGVYYKERESDSFYENKKRLAFIKKYAEE